MIMIGTTITEHYFPNLDPIDQKLHIHKFPFTIIDMLEKQDSVFGLNLDRQMIAPFNSQIANITHTHINLYNIIVQTPNPTALKNMKKIIHELMHRQHSLQPGEQDDFIFETSESTLKE